MTILEFYKRGRITYWEAWKQLYNVGMREPTTSYFLNKSKPIKKA